MPHTLPLVAAWLIVGTYTVLPGQCATSIPPNRTLFSTHVELIARPVAARRSLASRPTVFSKDLLASWGVPEDSELLLQSQSSCGNPPPVAQVSSLALLCSVFNATRECMGIRPDDPWATGSGCRRRSCVLGLPAKDSLCFLAAYGIDVDTKNATRNATCGLAPEDSHWLEPFGNVYQKPVGKDENCVSAFPPNVHADMYVECHHGSPFFKLKFTFETIITDGKYGCITSPACKEGMNFIARLLCYTEESGSPSNGNENRGVNQGAVELKPQSNSALENGGGITCLSALSYKVVLFAVLFSFF